MPLREESKSQLSLYLWFFQVVIVLAMISVVIWLSVKPKGPVYKVTNVYIPALDKQNSTFQNNNETVQNSSVILQFEITNPNKRFGIYYNDVNITLYHNDTVIGTNSLPGFYQGYKSTTLCEVLVKADHQHWRRGITSKAVDVIRVRLETALRYRILGSKTKHHRMDFEAPIAIGSDGRISGETDIKLRHMVKHIIKD